MKLLWALLALAAAASAHTHHAVETEMFAIPISPNLFNWTYQEFDQQYRFHASMLGKPELPMWLRYIYSGRHHSGFIFGTPPRGSRGSIPLEVVGLNRQDYETRRVSLTLVIKEKENMARYEVELKIDNLNVEDLLDEHKMTRLKDILRTKLWTESSADLYPTFLASAIDLGARLPLKPSDGEGLVVRLGSSMPFSPELERLREEVRPLSRLPSCPREYKRTTVERLFRDAGLTLDWCSFELYNTVYKEHSTLRREYLDEVPNTSKTGKSAKALDCEEEWTAPDMMYLPSRSYSGLLLAAVFVPLTLLMVCFTLLTGIACSVQTIVGDPDSDNFLDGIFHICIDYRNRNRRDYHLKVEMSGDGTGNPDETKVADSTSNKSVGVSPNNSLARPYSPKSSTNLAGNFNRPQPPPYMASATNSLHHRKSLEKSPSGSGQTPEHNRTHLLEESLKLLNEAKICSEFDNLPVKEPIIDLNDGTEDYVPLKSGETGHVSMNPDLDDFEVPELHSSEVTAAGNGAPPVKTWFC